MSRVRPELGVPASGFSGTGSQRAVEPTGLSGASAATSLESSLQTPAQTPAPPQPMITRAEWLWVGGMSVIILLLTQLPPTVERLFGPPERVHLGTYWYTMDFSQYLATMREAATSPSWLIHNHLSAEPHEPIFMYPLYVLLGKLAAASGITPLAWFAAAEIAMRGALPAVLYVFIAHMTPSLSARRFAFVLAAFSGGLGIWFGLAEVLLASGSGAASGRGINTFVETVTFGTFMAAPHIGMGLALTLLAVVAFGAACRATRWALLLLAIDVLLLATIHPFNLPVLLITFGAFAVIQSLSERRLHIRSFVATAVAGVVAAPLVIYNFVTFTYTPFWNATYGAQNVMPSPKPWELPIDYGLVLLAAPLGLLVLRRGASLEQRLLVTWLIIGVICMYLPVPYQRRFAFGLQPALAVLAALGWPTLRPAAVSLLSHLRVTERRQPGLARRLVHYPLLTLGFATPITAFFAVLVSAATNAPVPLYIVDRDTDAVGIWIGANSGPDDVVVGSFNTGNMVAGRIPGRVIVGYEVATLQFKAKRATLGQLYAGELPSEETQAFLLANRATYVIYGPEEQKLGTHDPGVALGLPVAIRIGATTAYRFPGPASSDMGGSGRSRL